MGIFEEKEKHAQLRQFCFLKFCSLWNGDLTSNIKTQIYHQNPRDN